MSLTYTFALVDAPSFTVGMVILLICQFDPAWSYTFQDGLVSGKATIYATQKWHNFYAMGTD